MKRLLSMLLIVAMICAMLPLIVLADNSADGGSGTASTSKQAYIKIPGVDTNSDNTNLDIIIGEGADPKYFITNEDGKATATGASADNYNIKFVYPLGGTPTLYLKDAKLTNGQWHALTIGRKESATEKAINDFSFIIYTETDSALEGTDNELSGYGTYSAIATSLNEENKDLTLTITGPGKLTATSEGQWAIRGDRKLIFKDANFVGRTTLSLDQNARAAILVNNDMVIDNSKVDLYATCNPVICLGNDSYYVGDSAWSLTIKNGSNVKVVNPESLGYLTSSILCNGEVTIERSTFELSAKANRGFYKKPIFIDVDTVAGLNASKTQIYNEKKVHSYIYFKCTPNYWVQENGSWYYYANNTLVANSWVLYNDNWYYMDASGVMAANAWVQDSYGWCYVDADGKMVSNQWVEDSYGWCYIGADGHMVTNAWAQDSQGWCYMGADGYMVYNQWAQDSKGWCYIGADGYMVYNQWAQDSKGWCYIGADGYMVYNQWAQDSKGWCYIGADGYMVYNQWAQDSYGWIWLDDEGYMAKDAWILYNGHWYYLNSDGYMATGWVLYAGAWYYMDTSGIMLANTAINYYGKIYYFNTSGVCTNP